MFNKRIMFQTHEKTKRFHHTVRWQTCNKMQQVPFNNLAPTRNMQESWTPMVKQQPNVPWAHLYVVLGCCNSPLLLVVTPCYSFLSITRFLCSRGAAPCHHATGLTCGMFIGNMGKPILVRSNGCKYHSHLMVFGGLG